MINAARKSKDIAFTQELLNQINTLFLTRAKYIYTRLKKCDSAKVLPVWCLQNRKKLLDDQNTMKKFIETFEKGRQVASLESFFVGWRKWCIHYNYF